MGDDYLQQAVHQTVLERLLHVMQRENVLSLQRALEDSGRLDQVVDVWRTLAQDARHALLACRQDELMEIYETMLRHWLFEFFQSCQVDSIGGSDIGRASEASGKQSIPLVDASRHPATWCLDHRLAVSLESIVNPMGGEFQLHDVISACDCMILLILLLYAMLK
jgi:hypothetical protein